MTTQAQGENTNQLIEIYKIHAAAADDVSRRRDSANRMYLGATTAVIIAMGVIARLGTGDVPWWTAIAGLGVLGALIESGWLGVIKAHRQLNEKKFEVLLELEKQLPFDFYQKEWGLMEEGKNPKVYREVTIAEKDLPRYFQWAFVVMTVGATVWGLVTTMS